MECSVENGTPIGIKFSISTDLSSFSQFSWIKKIMRQLAERDRKNFGGIFGYWYKSLCALHTVCEFFVSHAERMNVGITACNQIIDWHWAIRQNVGYVIACLRARRLVDACNQYHLKIEESANDEVELTERPIEMAHSMGTNNKLECPLCMLINDGKFVLFVNAVSGFRFYSIE